VSTSHRFAERRRFLHRATASALAASAPLLGACGGNDPRNAFVQTNLVASDAHSALFGPELANAEQDAEFINAWGIAIRPAGAGGHFWVGAGGYSFEFVGDVKRSPDPTLRTLFQDALTVVQIPGAGVPEGEADVTNPDKFIGFTTGVAFNGAALDSDHFVVRDQTVVVDGLTRTLEGSARFVFATDSGVVSAWTDRAREGDLVRRNGRAVPMIDGSAYGGAFFGLAIKPGTWDRLWVADFGADPQIRGFDKNWQPVLLGSAFANPFIGNKPKAEPGDYVPFNVQALAVRGIDRVFVAYAKSLPDPEDPSKFFAGEEDAVAKESETLRPDRGRVAMFDLEGRLLRVIADDQRLNAPWGLAVAPADFGPFSEGLLVGNFGGHGRIAAYELARGNFLGYLRRRDGPLVEIEGLWGLQFGNGASLGDADALYFAAGPGDETQGLFGVLRHEDASGLA
jgi:uncharacterized protein (TIGR03118 family)